MQRILFATIMALALLGIRGTAQADHCTHMARVSGEWMTLKNYIDSNDDDGLNMAEAQSISREEPRLIGPTIRLMSEAINDPRPPVRGQAQRLQGDLSRLDQIDDDNDWAEDSRIIFRIASDLANLARMCQMGA